MVEAKMISKDRMAVTLFGKTKEFDASPSHLGMEARYVFASALVRGGKDWPVSCYIRDDGSVATGYPSGVTVNRGTPRISGFWEDSQNKSKHNKV